MLDSLRFGEPTGTRSRYLLEHAVGGIGHYGNSIGVPTVGGEIYFEPAYEQNCLVNAMALGIAPHDRLTRAAATGPGNVLVLFGALTGRDGIGGASVLASAELDEDDADKRPTVQIGDPFAEKKLLECSLELLDSDLLVSLQDLGAAGLTSSSSEMASKGGLGLDIHVDRVPLREPGMEPFEIMVSESQERMLCVVEPSKVDAVLAVCEKWETTATAIGEVTDSGHLRVLKDGEVVGDMPVPALVDDCPLYDLAPEKPATPIYPTAPRALQAADDDLRATLPELLGSANIASRRPVFEQYDWLVQSRTVRRPEEADAAVLTLPDGSAIAVSIDGSGRRVAADPYRGTVEAVFECAANLACTGAEPLGLTNCLNFGNPEKPHVAWQLSESVRGMADACRALDTPVVGGNVSLYNESGGGPIYPTPVVGLVGRLPEAARAGRLGLAEAGDAIAVIRAASPSLPASELAKLRGDALPDGLPEHDTDALRAAIELVRDAVRRGDVRSAHDVAEGGLAVALSGDGAGRRARRDDRPDAGRRLDLPGQAARRAAVRRGAGHVHRVGLARAAGLAARARGRHGGGQNRRRGRRRRAVDRVRRRHARVVARRAARAARARPRRPARRRHASGRLSRPGVRSLDGYSGNGVPSSGRGAGPRCYPASCVCRPGQVAFSLCRRTARPPHD